MKRVKENRGFTLLELLTVLVIMSALAVIAIPIFMNKSVEAKQVAHNMNVSMLESQAQLYLIQEDVELPNYNIINGMLDAGYIREIPIDPLDGLPFVVEVNAEGVPSAIPGMVDVTGVETNRAYLSGLTTSEGPLTPTFNGGRYFEYYLTTESSSISLTATLEDVNDATMTLNTGNLVSGVASAVNLNIGSNTVTIVVTPHTGIPQTYRINVTRPSSAYLSNLALKSGHSTYSLTPAFARGTFSYDAAVGVTIIGVTITPTAEDDNATLKLILGSTTTDLTSGSPSGIISLALGETRIIKVEVTSNTGGVKKVYTINVTRPQS
ncbi:MAG: hypothetical protein A2Y24_01120 [Clostridiales bacterium GWE2_32_10]|nr:MAG: hypothetical protein A2Y24_01120 [Clostridiales bacterium GWE2_32_10]HBY21214.1 hypothetical protein [Clostridiales bacterium]